MEERQITEGGTTYPLPEPFLVIATQNPVETQGTFPLPEAQLDRFLLRLSLGYPDREEAVTLLQRFIHHQPLEAVESVADGQQLQPVLTSHGLGLQVAFGVFIVLTVLAMNRISMNNASTVSQRVSLGMRRKNAGMTVVLLVLAVGASFLPYIYDGLKALILWLVKLLLRLLITEPSEEQPGGAISPEVGPDSGLPIEEAAQSPLAQILEIIVLVFGILIVVGIAVFLAYWIVRKLVGLTRQLWAALERYTEAVSEDYQDEIIDTRRETPATRITKDRRSGIWHNDRKGPMSPREAIRYRYRRLLRKHPEWAASTTARENMPLGWAELYERSRYSDRPVTEEEAERFQSGTKRL